MITIKQAQMSDFGNVVKFYRELIDSMSGSEFMPEWKMGVYPTEDYLRKAIETQTLFLAYSEECTVGVFILNHDCEPEYENVKWQTAAEKADVKIVHVLGVSPSHQRKGIAKKIVSNIIEKCKKDGIKAIRLDVLKKNIPAAKLYLSMGFRYVDSVKIFYEDTGLTDFELYELVLQAELKH